MWRIGRRTQSTEVTTEKIYVGEGGGLERSSSKKSHCALPSLLPLSSLIRNTDQGFAKSSIVFQSYRSTSLRFARDVSFFPISSRGPCPTESTLNQLSFLLFLRFAFSRPQSSRQVSFRSRRRICRLSQRVKHFGPLFVVICLLLLINSYYIGQVLTLDPVIRKVA